jgi:beta-lactamase class A
MISRRGVLVATAGVLMFHGGGNRARGETRTWASLPTRLAAIEAESGGRLGVAVLDTATGRRAGHRDGERFPMCSTVKLLLTAATLARVDGGAERLDQTVHIQPADLIEYSPVTGPAAGGPGLSMEALAEAAMTLSDNTAANLLLSRLGGPSALTDFIRSIGDAVTRSDNVEPTLNDVPAGSFHDTTTPAAMLADLQILTLGPALSAESRERLVGWLIGCRTGASRLRADLPADWRVGDKTGSWGAQGTANDVAIAWPPERPPLLIAAYLTASRENAARRDAALAAVGRATADALTA